MQTVVRQNLNEVVAQQIKGHIIDKGLRVGDRLPTEQQMAERFGVSRISVREATKALSFLGIIRSAPRRGLTVGEVDMSRITEYLGFHLAVANYPSSELLDTRIVVETGALPFVLGRMKSDPSIYDRLNQLNDRLRKAKSNEERIEVDIAFHRALLEASGVSPLVAFNDLLQIFFIRFRQSVLKGAWTKGITDHQTMIDALRDGQLEKAIATLRSHIDYHQSHVQTAASDGPPSLSTDGKPGGKAKQ